MARDYATKGKADPLWNFFFFFLPPKIEQGQIHGDKHFGLRNLGVLEVLRFWRAERKEKKKKKRRSESQGDDNHFMTVKHLLE